MASTSAAIHSFTNIVVSPVHLLTSQIIIYLSFNLFINRLVRSFRQYCSVGTSFETSVNELLIVAFVNPSIQLSSHQFIYSSLFNLSMFWLSSVAPDFYTLCCCFCVPDVTLTSRSPSMTSRFLLHTLQCRRHMAFKAGEYDSFIGLTSHGVSRHCLPVIVSTLAYCLVLQQLCIVALSHSDCFQRSNLLPMRCCSLWHLASSQKHVSF